MFCKKITFHHQDKSLFDTQGDKVNPVFTEKKETEICLQLCSSEVSISE